MRTIHVHIPAEFVGTLHLHIGESEHDAELTSDNTTGSATVEQTLAKFENYDPGTNVRAFVAALLDTNWEVDTHPDGKYIRMIYHGDVIDPVTLLVNTINATNYNSATKRFAAMIEGADIRPNGNVVFPFDQGIDFAVKAARMIADYADGNLSISAEPAATAS